MSSRSLLILYSFLWIGCVEPSGDSPNDTDGGEDTALNGDTGSPDTGDAEEQWAELGGRLVWEDGSPATAIQVRLCYVSCSTTDPDEQGNYQFTKVKPGPYTLQYVRHGDRSYATPHGLVELGPLESRELPEIAVPMFQTRTDLSEATSVAIDGGLVVEADPVSMSKGLYSFGEDTYLSAVQLDPTTAGIPIDGIDTEDTVVGMWYLGAFDFQIDPPWPFSGTVDLGLPEGTTLRIRTASNDTKTWLDGGTAMVGEANTLSTDPGSGMNQLTTMVLVLEAED
jgi:hypothetical protein